MSNKAGLSFDQHVAKKGEPDSIKKARGDYNAAVKKLAALAPDDKEYSTAREAKRVASVALHNARTVEEQKFYAEEIEENTTAINEMKAEQAKPPTAKP